MNEIGQLLLSMLAGAVLGAVFFGGLWWTVRRIGTTSRPVLLFLGSVLLRVGITLAGFYMVAAGDWKRLLSCLLGFILARLVVTRMTRGTPISQSAGIRKSRSIEEHRHAP